MVLSLIKQVNKKEKGPLSNLEDSRARYKSECENRLRYNILLNNSSCSKVCL